MTVSISPFPLPPSPQEGGFWVGVYPLFFASFFPAGGGEGGWGMRGPASIAEVSTYYAPSPKSCLQLARVAE